jgi:serine/threonine protein phosphatase PrpC
VIAPATAQVAPTVHDEVTHPAAPLPPAPDVATLPASVAEAAAGAPAASAADEAGGVAADAAAADLPHTAGAAAASAPDADEQLTRVCVVKSYAGICEQGYQPHTPGKPNQDSIVMVEHPASDSLMLAVFDGHGDDGHLVSQHFRDIVPAAVFGSAKFNTWLPVADNIAPPGAPGSPPPPASPPARTSVAKPVGALVPRRDVAGALREALAAAEKTLLADPGVDCSLSGSTGCVVVISGPYMTVANIGDSRCILVRTAAAAADEEEGVDAAPGLQLTAHSVSVDHKPTLPSETRRILLTGGRVHSIKYDDGGEGPVRVWVRDDDVPGLAMSRSLGDTVGKQAGVISTPDIYTYTLTPSDAYVVLASDGLWEFTHGPDVADILARTHAEAYLSQLAHAQVLAGRQQRAAANAAAGEGEGAGGGGGPDAVGVDSEAEAEPVQHLQLALDTLADVAGTRWHEREGVIDDMSIILAEIGTIGLRADQMATYAGPAAAPSAAEGAGAVPANAAATGTVQTHAPAAAGGAGSE